MEVWDILRATEYRKIEKKKDKNRDWPTKIIGKIEQKNAPPSQATHFIILYDYEKFTAKSK